MRKTLSFSVAAAILLAAIGTWAVAKARPANNPAKLKIESVAPAALAPFELMKNSTDLPAQRHDAF